MITTKDKPLLMTIEKSINHDVPSRWDPQLTNWNQGGIAHHAGHLGTARVLHSMAAGFRQPGGGHGEGAAPSTTPNEWFNQDVIG